MGKINANDFTHELDRKALNTLKQIPAFTPLLKGFMKVFNEHTFHIVNMSGKIRISPEQLPQIYALLPPICERLGIEEPELYLELNRAPNAYTSGDTNVFITITSGLLEYMTEDEIRTVLAHECGHIACRHVLYHTMGNVLLSGAAGMLGLGMLFTTPLQLAFSYWMRCSEFSADRAAVICSNGPKPVVDVMVRLAGASRELSSTVNRELFMAQAAQYREYVDASTWNKVLEFLVLKDQNHPLITVRALDVTQWCESVQFQSIMKSMEEGIDSDSSSDRVFCPNCGKEIGPDWGFCKFCGQSVK